MFAVSRFAHYLKCMVRDKIGSTKEKDELERWLQTWINHYVDGESDDSSEEAKARKPLAAAKVEVVRERGEPGLLRGEVLPAAALPARRHGYRHEPRLAAERARASERREGDVILKSAAIELRASAGRRLSMAVSICVSTRSIDMAVDIFLKLEGDRGRITGCQAQGRDRRSCLVSWGVSKSGTLHAGSAAAAPARCAFRTCSFTKTSDKSSAPHAASAPRASISTRAS